MEMVSYLIILSKLSIKIHLLTLSSFCGFPLGKPIIPRFQRFPSITLCVLCFPLLYLFTLESYPVKTSSNDASSMKYSFMLQVEPTTFISESKGHLFYCLSVTVSRLCSDWSNWCSSSSLDYYNFKGNAQLVKVTFGASGEMLLDVRSSTRDFSILV